MKMILIYISIHNRKPRENPAMTAALQGGGTLRRPGSLDDAPALPIDVMRCA
ncbi:hypothetical protein [Ralstonia pseudosolanacearum]|uniref:hypothetical protein n=1 Tax=Ralstonia pseudosolanacearum TaxID=1310165 RepID=UPI0033999E71